MISRRVLRDLARLYSIQEVYEDSQGKKRKAPRETLLAALEMRVPAGVDLGEALREREERFWSRFVEPVTVVWGRRTPEIDLRLPIEIADAPVQWQLTLEDGSTKSDRVVPPSRRPLREGGYIGKTLTLPERPPFGYHVLRITIATESRETLIIAAPSKAHPLKSRSWGIFAPLNAAQTDRSWGCGDLGDLQSYRNWINGLGGGVVATLPLLASFDDEPSPYSPVSRLFWNELYLDVTRCPEFDSADLDPFAIEALSKTPQVDYAAVVAEKRRVLERMSARFHTDDDFRAFSMRGSYGYSHFRAAKEDRPDAAHYHLYVQYRMAQQMSEVAADAKRSGVGLYLDFPLGVNPGGYDAWKYADLFAKGASVGAPPDSFFTKGQNWGFPPLDPDATRERRHQYFRDCIRHHVSHAGVLRIDHVMGLHRLFWIPEGGEPKDGVYVRYPEDELYAVLAVESSRYRCAIIGEDLGTVPQYVPRMMAKRGLRRMYVAQYELKPDSSEPLAPPPVESVAGVNTHDMPTFAGFWTGKDIDERLELSLLDNSSARAELQKRQDMRDAVTAMLKARGLLHGESDETATVLKALLSFLAGSTAEIVLVNLEDLWLEENPQNVPGVPERSWRNKFRYTLEQMRSMPDVVDALRMIDERRRTADGITT